MKYINQFHKKLSKAQTSALMLKINRHTFDKRVGMIAAALFTGVASMAMAWSGTGSARIYFCIKSPSGEVCADKNNRPFRMTPYHWEQWGLNGRSKYVVKKRVELPANPAKPFQSAVGFVSFAVAGWVFRQFQFEQNQKSKWDALIQRRDEAIAELHTQIELMEVTRDLELSATDNAVIIQQAELLGEVEVKLTQMEAGELIFEAETAGMTEEQRSAYVEFIRNQQTPYLTGTQTLGKTVDPKDKVEGNDTPGVITPIAWVNNLVRQTALIWGNQGGGKSWLARYVAKLKKDAGYKVIALDPDSNRSEWEGVESYHSWEDIEQQIRNYVDELESRLKIFNESSMGEEEWRSKLWGDGKAVSLIIEEATTYSSFIKDVELLEKFGKLFLTKSRKQEMPVTVVSHNNTQICLFGIKGLHNLVVKMLQVECLAEVDKVTLKPRATGHARVKLDSSNEWLDVELPKLTAKITSFGTTSTSKTPIDRQSLERIWDMEFEVEGGKEEVTEVPMEVEEVRNNNSCGNLEVLPSDMRSEALSKILLMLNEIGSKEVTEVISLITTNPDKAVWLGIKRLNLGVTSASRDVFGCGMGGRAFTEKAKPWYEALEQKFGKIRD